MNPGDRQAVWMLVARFRRASQAWPSGRQWRRSLSARARERGCEMVMAEVSGALCALGHEGFVTLLRAEHDLRVAALADPSAATTTRAREATAEMFAHLRELVGLSTMEGVMMSGEDEQESGGREVEAGDAPRICPKCGRPGPQGSNCSNEGH